MSEYNSTTTNLMNFARDALMGVENTQRMIWNSAGNPPSASDATFDVTLTKPNLTEPPKFSDVFEYGDRTNPEVMRLNDEADAFLAKYFPAINACLKTLPEDWLCGVISGVKPFGIDSTIFDLVWQKARDRATRSRLSDQRTMEASMSARGFTLPPGALVDLSMKMQQRMADDLSDVNRDQAIKDADIKKEILLFAEEQALKYKLGLMQVMGDLYKVWALIPNNDIERARVRAQAWASYYNALGSYYNVEIAFEELRLKAAQADANVQLANTENDIKAFAASQMDKGLGDAARAFGDIAQGASSAASSLVAQVESI